MVTPVQNGTPIAQTTSPIELLTWYERLNQLPTAERQREIQSVVQRSQRHKGELLRLQAALGLSTLDHIEARQRALVLLEPLLSSKTLEPSYRPLVHVLVNLLSEVEKQHQRAEEALQQFKQSDAPVRDRNKRSFWLSAARSALFNQIVAERLKKADVNQVVDGDALQLAGRGSWFVATTEELAELQRRVNDKELMITAALPGSGEWGTQREALAFEQAAVAAETELQALLVREKVEAARRAMLLYPQQLSWNWWDDVTVEIRFWLPAGSFATSVVRELINTTGDYAHIAE